MKTLFLAVLLCATAVVAQDKAPTGGRPSGERIETATRGVVRYQAMERKLLQAEQGKDVNALQELVSDDFEERSAEHNRPTPRDQWESLVKSGDLAWFQLRNMAVHEFGDIAVVSFLLDRRGQRAGKSLAPTVFIVDVWRQSEGKLAVRYVSSPGHPASPQLMPTGKE